MYRIAGKVYYLQKKIKRVAGEVVDSRKERALIKKLDIIKEILSEH